MKQIFIFLLLFSWAKASLAESSLTYNKADPLVVDFLSIIEECIPYGEKIPGVPKEAYYVTLEEFIDMQMADTIVNVSPHQLSMNAHIYSKTDGNFKYIIIKQTASSPEPDLVRYSPSLQYYKIEPTRFVFAGSFHLQENGDRRPVKESTIFTQMSRSHNRICNEKLATSKAGN